MEDALEILEFINAVGWLAFLIRVGILTRSFNHRIDCLLRDIEDRIKP